MRIGFVSFEYPPAAIGGAGHYAFRITRELANMGHEVVIFTRKGNASVNNKWKNLTPEIKSLNEAYNGPAPAGWFWLRLPQAIAGYERRCKLDCVHINGSSYPFFRKRPLTSAPHVLTVHHIVRGIPRAAHETFSQRLMDLGGENGFVLPLIESRCLAMADKIVSVSEFTKSQIVAIYGVPPERIRTIHHGVDLPRHDIDREAIEALEAKLGLPQGPTILFVGRIDDPRKRLSFMLAVFRKVLDETAASLLVVGRGDLTKAQELARTHGVAGKTIFAGYLNRRELETCYALCSVYVCTSSVEGFSFTVAEAMAGARPVVSSRVGGIPEIVRNEDNGLLVEPYDTEAFARAICKVIGDPTRFNEMGVKSREYVRRDLTWRRAATELARLYEDTAL